MIDISQLQVIRDGKTICAVEQFAVARGERVAVIGANGSGKTTLLRVLAGLETEYAGTCYVDARREERTYLHQQPYLFRGAVMDNVRYGQRGRGEGTEAAVAWLDRLGIRQLADRTTRNLSGGEVRRVALARALALRPQLLLLDEPFAELDPEATETVCKVLNGLQDTTVLIASPADLPPTFVATMTFKLN